jgi:excisionase family DNA binding protein
MKTDRISDYMTVEDASRELGKDPATVRAAIKRGGLPARKVLGRWRLNPADVRRAAAGLCFGEQNDDIAALKAENDRLRADNERLRSHAANIKHLMDGQVQIENTTIWAELCKMVDQ